MTNLPKAFQYTMFPEGSWRIAWVGEVKFIRNTHNVNQPVITVTLQSTNEPNHFKEIYVAIGQMTRLIIGSEWIDGIEQNHDTDRQQTSFNLSTYQAKFIKAGSSLSEHDEQSLWLPFTHHNQHKFHTESWCILVTLDKVDIIISCTEMLHFYFGSSSNLLKQIVRNYFTPQDVWQDYVFDTKTGHLNVALASGISGASAADIGRIITDKSAFDAVTLISKTITTAIANREKAYIKKPFPFMGKTKLQVQGQWYRFEGMKDRFIVSQIESCSHRLPFLSLRYVSHSSVKKEMESLTKPESQSVNNPQEKSFIKSEPKVNKLVNDEPNNDRKVKILNVSSTVRFPDLIPKIVVRVTPTRTDMVVIGHTETNKEGSTGEGDGRNSKVSKVDLCLTSPFEPLHKPLKSPVAAWEKYFELLSGLKHQSWIKGIEFLKLDSRQVEQHFAQLPNFVNDDGEVLFDSLANTNKPNRVSICRVRQTNDLAWFMVSFEPESAETCCFSLLEPDSEISWTNIFNLMNSTNTSQRSFQLSVLDTPKIIEHIKKLDVLNRLKISNNFI